MINAKKAYTDSFLHKQDFYQLFSSQIEHKIIEATTVGRLQIRISFTGSSMYSSDLCISSPSFFYNFKTFEEEMKNNGYEIKSVLNEDGTDIKYTIISWSTSSFVSVEGLNRIHMPELIGQLSKVIG